MCYKLNAMFCKSSCNLIPAALKYWVPKVFIAKLAIGWLVSFNLEH